MSLFSFSVLASEAADVIYINAKIWTADSSNPTAQAIAIGNNKILAVGSNEEITGFKTDATKIVDLHNKRVTPGFIDNHTHFADTSGLLSAVQLRDVTSKRQFVDRIKNYAAGMQPGEWMLMGIWDHESWGGELPEANWINDVTRDNPVFLLRTDGHMALANQAAMAAAGVTNDTADVPGGEIIRDKNGNLTGVFKDAAMDLFWKFIPALTVDQQAAVFQKGIDHAVSLGVTQIHDMGTWQHLQSFQQLQQKNLLKMRVYSFVPLQTHQKLADFVKQNGRGNDIHRWGGLKGLVDGSLGSTTAWFYEPYTDEPDKFGFPIYDLKSFKQWMVAGDKSGLNITIHAIGDKANDWVLNSFEDISTNNPPNQQRRWRIEHAQHLSKTAINRISKLGVIASMQPYHAIDDGRWAEKRIGAERIKTTYAFKSLLDAGALLTFGSDSPVAPMNVMQGLYAAVTRRTLDGLNPKGWVPAEKINLEQALRAYTINNAYAGFQENKLGQLKAGFLADFVVLDQDIFEIPAEQLKHVEVLMTVVNGKLVFEKNE
jgi:hypothetical protein